MSVNYRRDQDGVVHVMASLGDNEFTYCDRCFDGADAGPDSDLEDQGEHPGPATCSDCREVVDRIRHSLRGVRWRTPGYVDRTVNR